MPAAVSSKEREAIGRFVDLYCVECHNGEDKAAGLALDVHRLGGREPAPGGLGEGRPEAGRPADAAGGRGAADGAHATTRSSSSLAGSLDRAAAEHPDPGRTDTFRRLNRTEYQNAIRDLLALDIDAAALLPADESSHGFDNVTVGDLSPTLLDRYITAAQKISRLAVGSPGRSPGGDTIRIRPDLTQEEHVEGLPLGTRGGALIPYTFPQDGEYEIQLRLTRDRNEHVEGLREPHELEVLLDRERMASFTVKPPPGGEGHQTRRRAPEGPHPGDGRPARARRDVPEEPVVAARDQAPAVPGPLQHAPAPAASRRRSTRSRSPARIDAQGPRRHAQPPPDLRLRAEGAGRGGSLRQADPRRR